MSFLNNNQQKAKEEPLDEEALQTAHKKVYDEDDVSQMDSRGIGAAAAVQALKTMTGSNAQQSTGSSSLMAMALTEASKLFDKRGAQVPGEK